MAEVEYALSFSETTSAFPSDWAEKGTVDYFYVPGELLVQDDDLPRALAALKDLEASPRESVGLLDGLTLLRVPRDVPELCDQLDERLGVGVMTPHHLFAVMGYAGTCPATEPEYVVAANAPPERVRAALWPRVGEAGGGAGVLVSVVDSGLIEGVDAWAPWLGSGVRPNSANDIENPDELDLDRFEFGTDDFADPYAGHGTFVAGVVRCIAPAAEIVVDQVFDKGGLVTEAQLITQLSDALTASPDIINLSAGAYTRRNAPSLGFLTLYEERLRHLGGVLLVAAAGNDARRDPFWPAAFPWCVGVGSMTRDGLARSWFSNYGSWVDVYAPGEDLVNAYPQLRYKTLVGRKERDTRAGIVKWSGTSFSTPIVIGLIANRMSRTGETAQVAADALLAAARVQFRPGVGPRLFP